MNDCLSTRFHIIFKTRRAKDLIELSHCNNRMYGIGYRHATQEMDAIRISNLQRIAIHHYS